MIHTQTRKGPLAAPVAPVELPTSRPRLEVLRVKLPAKLLRRLDVAASEETSRREERVTRSDIVRAALHNWLNAHESDIHAARQLRALALAPE